MLTCCFGAVMTCCGTCAQIPVYCVGFARKNMHTRVYVRVNSFRFGQANVCMERSVSGLALELSQLEETLSLAHCEAQHVRSQVCALPWRSDVGAS